MPKRALLRFIYGNVNPKYLLNCFEIAIPPEHGRVRVEGIIG